MTVATLITSILAKVPHTFTNQDILDFINDVEAQAYNDTIKDLYSTYIPLVAYQPQYSFPTGVGILDCEAVFLYGNEIPKLDIRQKNIKGYYVEGAKLTISPVPSESDSSYVSGAGEITFAANSITTTGDDFEEFVVGDIVLISGATTAANNKYALVVSVADKVLTFPASTFSAGLDAGAVTISVPSLEVIARYKPTTKLLANIATDTLLLPDAFIDVYRYYAYAQMNYLRENFDIGNNWLMQYQTRLNDLKVWYGNTKPKAQIPNKKRW